MGGLLTKFLKAGFASAASAIVLNGIPTPSFLLKRSVRQGCPLSPLMFIVAFDVLSLHLQLAITRRTIQGVTFSRIGVRTLHNMYADDLVALIRALLKYIEEFQRLLTWFGSLSGLHCAWEKTVASLVPAGPPPHELRLLPWKWEDNSTASPLLGAPMAESIAQERLEVFLVQKMDSRISKYQQLALSFAARVLVANSLILGCIWYLMILWAGEERFLKRLQAMVDHFIWNGRSRVARATITIDKAHGGLGQIDIAAQYRALTGSLIVWVSRSGTHPLRSILRGHIELMSHRRWGTSDLSWVVSPSGRMKSTGSSTWQHICRGWHDLKTHISAKRPHNLAEWRALPLWRPHVNHQLPDLARCMTRPQRALRDRGIGRMGDILNDNSALCSWAEVEARWTLPPGLQTAYLALTHNLVQVPELDPSSSPQEFYVESLNLPGLHLVWKFLLPPVHCTERWLPFMDRSSPAQAFSCRGNILQAIPLRTPGVEVRLRRIVVYSNGKQHINAGPWHGDNILFTQYHWQGGTPLTHSSTHLLRQIQNQHQARDHPAIRKWETQLASRLPEHIWHNTWLPFRSAKENSFMWLILFRAIATMSWVFPGRPDTDDSTWCPRCPGGVREDILHCLWQCPTSQICWLWTAWIITRAAGSSTQVQLTAAQIILAASFPNAIEVPFCLWQILRASMCWHSWIARNVSSLTSPWIQKLSLGKRGIVSALICGLNGKSS